MFIYNICTFENLFTEGYFYPITFINKYDLLIHCNQVSAIIESLIVTVKAKKLMFDSFGSFACFLKFGQKS